jgi:hypothetical protein
VNAAVYGRPEDRVRHLGQRTSIALGELGRRRAVPGEQTPVVFKLLAGAGAFQPAVEGDPRGPPDEWFDVAHVVLASRCAFAQIVNKPVEQKAARASDPLAAP